MLELHSLRHRLTQTQDQLLRYARDIRYLLDKDPGSSLELEQFHHCSLTQLMRVCEVRGCESSAHMRRVGLYAAALAQRLDLPEHDQHLLGAAATIHDLGKTGLPDSILRKPTPLDPDETRQMRKHPLIGAHILDGATSVLLTLAREIMLTHHERFDGTGYPAGLRGKQVPFSSRIVHLAVVYDTLRMQTVYKPALDHAAACLILLEGDHRTHPRHFDPAVLEAFRLDHARFAQTFRENPENIFYEDAKSAKGHGENAEIPV